MKYFKILLIGSYLIKKNSNFKWLYDKMRNSTLRKEYALYIKKYKEENQNIKIICVSLYMAIHYKQ